MTKIKFCGFTREEDVKYAVDLGIHAFGFNREPSSPRYLDSTKVAQFAAALPPFQVSVSVYGRYSGEYVPTNLAQFVECETMPSVPSIWALRLGGDLKDLEGIRTGNGVVALLLDAYSPDAYGGTGKTIDWQLAATATQFVSSVILAGGLTPDNVAEAIRIVRPYAVDVSSGIESSPGIKDRGKMKAFVEAVRSAG